MGGTGMRPLPQPRWLQQAWNCLSSDEGHAVGSDDRIVVGLNAGAAGPGATEIPPRLRTPPCAPKCASRERMYALHVKRHAVPYAGTACWSVERTPKERS